MPPAPQKTAAPNPDPDKDAQSLVKQGAERRFLLAKLREYHWNVAETARALDMPRARPYL